MNLKIELLKLLADIRDDMTLPGREWKRMVQAVVDKCGDAPPQGMTVSGPVEWLVEDIRNYLKDNPNIYDFDKIDIERILSRYDSTCPAYPRESKPVNDDISANESFEIAAEAFYKVTGMLMPGKYIAAGAGWTQENEEEREKLFKVWCAAIEYMKSTRRDAPQGLLEEMINWWDEAPMGVGLSNATDNEIDTWREEFGKILSHYAVPATDNAGEVKWLKGGTIEEQRLFIRNLASDTWNRQEMADALKPYEISPATDRAGEECPNCKIRPGGVIKVDDNGNCINCHRPICGIKAGPGMVEEMRNLYREEVLGSSCESCGAGMWKRFNKILSRHKNGTAVKGDCSSCTYYRGAGMVFSNNGPCSVCTQEDSQYESALEAKDAKPGNLLKCPQDCRRCPINPCDNRIGEYEPPPGGKAGITIPEVAEAYGITTPAQDGLREALKNLRKERFQIANGGYGSLRAANIDAHETVAAIDKILSCYEVPATESYGLREELEVYAKCISVLPSGKGIGDNLLEMLSRHKPNPREDCVAKGGEDGTTYLYTHEEVTEILKRNAQSKTIILSLPAQDGLREFLQAIVKEKQRAVAAGLFACSDVFDWCSATAKEIFSCHPAPTVEPLAELADRKGMAIWMIDRSCVKDKRGWVVSVANDSNPIEFFGLTYQEAESKARQFLMSLPDK